MQPENSETDITESEHNHFLLYPALVRFVKESPGIAVTLAYLVMILTSTCYLYFLFDAFDINIIKFIALEDLLVAPIRNPDIILVFLFISVLFYFTDFGSRYRARQNQKYAGKKKPFGVKVLLYIFWTPNNQKASKYINLSILALSLTTYIFVFAGWEADSIKRGGGEMVELTLSDGVSKAVTLLGTSNYYVFTYDHEQRKSEVYSLEVLRSLTPLKHVSAPAADAKPPRKSPAQN